MMFSGAEMVVIGIGLIAISIVLYVIRWLVEYRISNKINPLVMQRLGIEGIKISPVYVPGQIAKTYLKFNELFKEEKKRLRLENTLSTILLLLCILILIAGIAILLFLR